jgi:ribosomal protein S18 acetylase RimI-like enzyme
MNIVYDRSLTVSDYNNLRKAVGWNEINERQAGAGIGNSAYLVAAHVNHETVGMARLITDGGYVAYIADVIVHPDYQKQGIGKTMLRRIMNYLEANLVEGDTVCVVLMAAKEKENFYKQLGFVERPTERLGAGMSQWISKKPLVTLREASDSRVGKEIDL